MSHEGGNVQGNQGSYEGSNDEPTQPMEIATPAGGQSRRAFLRNAVIGSAAAAAAVGVGAVVAANTPVGPKLLGKVAAFNSLASPTDPYAICFEETGLPGNAESGFNVDANGKGTTPGSFWLFYTARALPAGNYTLVLTESVNGGAGTAIGNGTSPFGWQNSSAVNVDVTSGSVADCPTSISGSGGGSYGPIGCTAGQTIQWAIHLTWNGGTIGPATTTETLTFTASLSGVSGSSRTTGTITVTQS